MHLLPATHRCRAHRALPSFEVGEVPYVHSEHEWALGRDVELWLEGDDPRNPPPDSRTTAAIIAPIRRISSSFIPRVVRAGVPRRIPEAVNGFCVSNGIVFLLTVMFAASSAFSATLPVMPFPSIQTSTSIR